LLRAGSVTPATTSRFADPGATSDLLLSQLSNRGEIVMQRRSRVGLFGTAALALSLTGGCSSSNGSEGSRGTTSPSEAKAEFCDDLGDYLTVLDRYGRVFSDEEITVGQLQADATALEAARSVVERSASELAEAINAANTVATAPTGTGGTGGTVGTTTTVLATQSADDHQKAIETAERELDRTVQGVDENTPVRQATAEVHAAAFGLEQAYVSLFVDAGCLEGNAAATDAVRSYTTGLQQDLTTLGYYTGPVDGLYGPSTVAAIKDLQASAGLPKTGVVDPQTEAALSQQLAQKNTQQSLNIAGLQGALTVAGFYSGPIDGKWTPAVESALKAFQEAQDLPPTGTLDTETLAALLGLKQAVAGATTTTTTAPSTTTTTSSTAP
jgi:peptidoglycan hydrolase-like protein with peptidoglycan-binding domain